MSNRIVSLTHIAADTLPVFYSIGLIANILSIVIFSRRRFKKTIFETYFRFMSFTDLISLAYPINSYFIFRYDIETYDMSYLICSYLDFIQFVFPATSAWLLTMISFDRMIIIVFPTHLTNFKKSSKFQYGYCVFALACSMIAYSPLFYYREFNLYTNFNNQTNQTSSYYLCELKPGAGSVLWTDIFYGNIVPAVIMLILNIFTIKALFKSRFKASIDVSKRDIRFAITSFALIIFFFLSSLFSQLYLLLFAYDYFETYEQSLFWNTLACLTYTLYFSSMFFVNMIVNLMFREECLNILNEITSFFIKKNIHSQ